MTTDRIPIDGEHKGIGLHAGQAPARLTTVRADIDRVHAEDGLDRLAEIAGSPGFAPEARLFAHAKCLAILGEAVDRREHRPRDAMSRDYIAALTAGLNSIRWQSPWCYASLIDPPATAVPRQERIEP